MDANSPTSWMMTAVKLEEEEKLLWREVKLGETDSEDDDDDDDDDDEGCRRKAEPKLEETEEFPSNAADQISVKEESLAPVTSVERPSAVDLFSTHNSVWMETWNRNHLQISARHG
ncbi:zinc finger and BTB domain-containing protein 7C-like isoform X3 [Gouania willdenowi]|uniref:zinc finger and BTB domain-containing protein 7C-like isoform X3 n=1 Tax=Gouania willdenowi TaxID=441366 RepID=UPI00105414E8|nr:zinc finger and BTB domain-containing protein 7C-like isoform X3 [Gouania willdenowi]